MVLLPHGPEPVSYTHLRDYRDMHRENSPLKQAKDAVLVDSSEMTVEQVIETIKDIARRKGLET